MACQCDKMVEVAMQQCDWGQDLKSPRWPFKVGPLLVVEDWYDSSCRSCDAPSTHELDWLPDSGCPTKPMCGSIAYP